MYPHRGFSKIGSGKGNFVTVVHPPQRMPAQHGIVAGVGTALGDAFGQRQRIALARALAIEPKVLLLDEPMAGLGPAETQEMIELLRQLGSRYAILLVEHDMHAVFSLATVCSVLVYGKVVFTGTAAEVRDSAEVREAYLGDEEIPA
mgnify:CR=1 FL=1